MQQAASRRDSAGAGTGNAVILLGTDTPIGLAVIRDLGRHGYKVVGIGRTGNALGGASRYCAFHVVRAPEEAGLIAQIGTLAAQFGAAYLLAISETDLMLINRHRSTLEQSLMPLVPTADKLALVLDKLRCQSIAQEVGIRSPATISPESLADAAIAAETLSYPVVLKWSNPHEVSAAIAAAGLELHRAYFVADRTQLLAYLERYQAAGRFPMIQEYCHGRGVGHMFLARDGEVLIEFQHERVHEWPPEGGASSLCRTVPLDAHREARGMSRALLRRLGWTGVAMIEYRYDPTTESWRFLEINGRFWGSLPLAIDAGIPFAAGLVAAIGEHRPVPAYRSDYPRRHCMFWVPETKRLMRILFWPGKIGDPYFKIRRLAEVAAYLRYPLGASTGFYVFSWNDPGPFLRDSATALGKFHRALCRR